MAPPGPRLRLPALAGVAALSLALPASGGEIHFLQWNPHWQCFLWNQNGCKANVEALASSYLKAHDVDFANFVEFASLDYRPPGDWSLISSTCGDDLTYLAYNAARWNRSSVAGAGKVGCMVDDNRPFILQLFDSIPGAVGEGVPSQVLVVGAHFPHPDAFGEHLTPELAGVLKGAIADAVGATGVNEVVLLADTNEYKVTSSSVIGAYLDFPSGAGRLLSTDLEETCCTDGNFPWWGTFDRVISNFGTSMQTTLLMDQVPSWAYQEQGSKKGAFHKPIFGSLTVPKTTTSTTTATTTSTTTVSSTTSTTLAVLPAGSNGWVIGSAVACVVLALAGLLGWLAVLRRRRRAADARGIGARLTSGQGHELPATV